MGCMSGRESENIRAVRLIVKGKVQGVFYRKYAVLRARELGVRGYVKNESDGSVSMVVVGEPNQVEEMIRWAWVGSPHAVVTSVDVIELDASTLSERFTTFDIRY